ncbi:MAG: MASE1 domain-containing protein [Acidobacteria bacterium]|nr:MASE1 domain-containing protein [Acidobacteriota bacterium]MCG3192866.1 Sensor histidine kinase RcsC [Thermoanaerobaculia bacterium]MCK6681258.1 MASE1 domain-containing protein [Thermoanaerobaculia bacterium]
MRATMEPHASRSQASVSRIALVGLVVAAAYAITGRLGMLAAIPPGLATAIWPPAGIALAAVYLKGRWMAVGVAIGSVLVNTWGAAAAGTLDSSTFALSALFVAAGAALQALAGAALVKRFLEQSGGSPSLPFRSARGVTLFFAAALLTCVINSTIGSLAISLLKADNWPGFQTTWWTWWLGDTAGVLVFAPAILAFAQPGSFAGRTRLAETLLFAISHFAVAVFGFWGNYPLAYLAAPVLVWAALRFGVRGGTASILAFSLIALLGTIHGVGPFIRSDFSRNESLLLLQGFMASCVLTTLVLAAVVEERVRARESLEQTVAERTRELSNSLQQMVSLQRETEAAMALAEQSGEKAREADRAKSTFLAQMSHELRTPLSAIIGYAELISEGLDDARRADLEPDLAKIRSSAQHLLSLINQILDLSKIEAGKIDLICEEVQIRKLAAGLAATLETLARKRGNRTSVDVDPVIESIETDGLRLKQILLNLISNACKFTRNGEISLRILRVGKNSVAFEVRDTGIGMTEEQTGRLFQPFMQVDTATHRAYGGTGIGLALSRQLANAMGGDITVQSEYGKGSLFTLVLPRSMPSPQAP